MRAITEDVTGTGIIAVGYGCGTGMVPCIELAEESEEEVGAELVGVVLMTVEVVRDGVEVVETGA